MPKGRAWTSEDLDYLETYYGVHTIKAIAEQLKRSEKAIIAKARRLSLSLKDNGGNITVGELSRVMKVDRKTIFRWFKKGLKHKKKKLYQQTFLFISISHFWDWAEQHKDTINLLRMEKGLLLPEPDWLDAAIRDQAHHTPKRLYKKWTELEDATLIAMYKKGCSYSEIGKSLNRSASSVKTRYGRLLIKGVAEKKRYIIYWSEEEIELFLKMEQEGCSSKEIASELGRSPQDVDYKRRNLRAKGYRLPERKKTAKTTKGENDGYKEVI